MSTWFLILTILFIVVSALMVLIILVQRPQGGGLAGAFGGASGGGQDTVFGGRVGDALTVMTVITFAAYLLLALGLNVLDNKPSATIAPVNNTAATAPASNTPARTPTATRPAATPATPAASGEFNEEDFDERDELGEMPPEVHEDADDGAPADEPSSP